MRRSLRIAALFLNLCWSLLALLTGLLHTAKALLGDGGGWDIVLGILVGVTPMASILALTVSRPFIRWTAASLNLLQATAFGLTAVLVVVIGSREPNPLDATTIAVGVALVTLPVLLSILTLGALFLRDVPASPPTAARASDSIPTPVAQ